MKIIRISLLILITGVLLNAQTVHLGQQVFYSEVGGIILAADASLTANKLESDYVPFVLYMASNLGSATIPRENVVMVYEGNTYPMVPVKELRSKYNQDNRDYRQYNNFYMGVESLLLAHMGSFRFDWSSDFFPPRSSGLLATDEAGISGTIGFKTFAYFKNPGFKKGDQVVIRVFDKNKSDFYGEVAVILGEE